MKDTVATGSFAALAWAGALATPLLALLLAVTSNGSLLGVGLLGGGLLGAVLLAQLDRPVLALGGVAVASSGLVLLPGGLHATPDRLLALAVVGGVLVTLEAAAGRHRLAHLQPAPSRDVARGSLGALWRRLALLVALLASIVLGASLVGPLVLPEPAASSMERDAPLTVAALALALSLVLVTVGAWRRRRATREA